MATTIITDTTPLTLTQYGVCLPDGQEFWATGYFRLEGDKLDTPEINNVYENGQLVTLKRSIFKGINLAHLVAEVPAPHENMRQFITSRKGDAAEGYWKVINDVAKSTGINAAEYEEWVTIISRTVTVLLGETTTHDAPGPDVRADLEQEYREYAEAKNVEATQ